MLNILTIDVEDYFQVNAFSKYIRYDDWGTYECRVERNTHRLLDILAAAAPTPHAEPLTPYAVSLMPALNVPTPGVKATFFVLGWIAERYPSLIKEIKARGHEVASHGCNHQIVSSMSPEQFREDIHRSKSILEDLTGDAVIGYRAPNYSMGDQQLWALQTLAEEGYQYDSSIYPIRHDTYGMPDAPRFPFTIVFNGNGDSPAFDCGPMPSACSSSVVGPLTPCAVGLTPAVDEPYATSSPPYALSLTPYARSLIEFPLSTVRLANVNIPVAGGGYFRLFPYRMVRRGLRRINREEERPFIFFLHPWEIDAEQPRIAGACIKSRFRHYINLDKSETKFKKLLEDFQFSSVREIIERNMSALTELRIAYSQNLRLAQMLEYRSVGNQPKGDSEGR